MRSSKASKEAKQPDKEAQQEQKLILKDVRDKMFRAAVVPAAYSVEEFLLGMCKFDEIRMKTIKLTEDEVGYGQYAMRNLGKRIMSAYFKPNPKLFEEIFGFPMSELKEEGLLCMRPWHDEVIMVMAPPKPPMRCFYNSIIRETLSSNDQSRVSWTGNLLCLSSSLQSEICPDLGGLTRYALNGLLQEKLGKAAAPALEAAWKSKQAGLDMQKQFGWIKDLPQPGPPAPPASAPLDTHLEFMITGWKQTRCLLPYRHPPDKCTGYHVMAAGVNSNTMVFDARRPPVGKDGSVLYQPEWCRSGPDVSVREGKDTAYYSCPTGPSCNKAHSRLELFYHPGFFKHEKCEGVSGGKM